MNQSGRTNDPTTQAIEIAVRLGLIFLILAWCLMILTPFLSLIVWGGIIAIAIYPLFTRLAKKLGGNTKLAVVLIAIVGIGVILVPVISLSDSLIESATRIGQNVSSGTVEIPPPAESVQEWPLVGEKAYALWHEASVDLTALLEEYPDQLAAVGKKLLGMAAGAGLGVLQFIVSLIIAAAFLASVDTISVSMRRLARRLSPENGEDLLVMSNNTVRSVAVGVIGIAFIQAVLGGLGMMFVGVPAAGLLAIFILVLGIAQLPPLLVLLPVAIYVFSVESTTVAVVFLVWSLLVSFSDAVLKPLLLGRGVDAPMMVILLGAIGGMIVSGIVGLFIGAVILAVGYKLFQAWVRLGDPDLESQGADAAATE
jgi:predicted PurR-regulated permease PerM